MKKEKPSERKKIIWSAEPFDDDALSECDVSRGKKKRHRPRGPKNWLVPANPKYYDVVEAFRHRKVIEWKQSTDVSVGDLVYLYVAAPYSAVMFKCRAVRVNIPLEPPDEMLHIDRLMEIELLCAYDRALMPLSRMTDEFHVLAVRGPRYLPGSLKYELDLWEGNAT